MQISVPVSFWILLVSKVDYTDAFIPPNLQNVLTPDHYNNHSNKKHIKNDATLDLLDPTKGTKRTYFFQRLWAAPGDTNLDADAEARRIRSAYLQWCERYKKQPNESRYPQFVSNFKVMASIAKKGGKPMHLNEFADFTGEEYQAMMAKKNTQAGTSSVPASTSVSASASASTSTSTSTPTKPQAVRKKMERIEAIDREENYVAKRLVVAKSMTSTPPPPPKAPPQDQPIQKLTPPKQQQQADASNPVPSPPRSTVSQKSSVAEVASSVEKPPASTKNNQPSQTIATPKPSVTKAPSDKTITATAGLSEQKNRDTQPKPEVRTETDKQESIIASGIRSTPRKNLTAFDLMKAKLNKNQDTKTIDDRQTDDGTKAKKASDRELPKPKERTEYDEKQRIKQAMEEAKLKQEAEPKAKADKIVDDKKRLEAETKRKIEDEKKMKEAEAKADAAARRKAAEERKRLEAEAKRKEEEERTRLEAEAKAKIEEEAKKKAEEERKRLEAEAKAKAEDDAKRKEEEERKRIEAEAKAKVEEAKRKAEKEKKRLEAEAKAKAEEEAKKKAEEERKRVEAEAKRKAEEERNRLEAEAKRKAEEERKRIEAEAKAKAEAEAKRKAEEERKRLEAEAKAKAEAERKAEEERKRLEAEAKAKAEAERKAEEERKRLEAEAKAKAEVERKAEEERKRLEDEAKAKAEAEAKRKAEEERKRIEAEAKRKAEEERIRLEAEAEAKRRAEEERKRIEAEAKAEAKRKAEEERKRKEVEAKAKAEAKRKAEEERKRVEAEAKAKKMAEEKKRRLEAEAKRKAEEEKKRIEAKAKAEAKRKAEEEKRRLAAEARAKAEEERKQKEAQAKAKAEEERKRKEAEAKAKAEEERKRIEAEAKAKAEEERKRKEAEAKAKAEEERKQKEAEAKAKAEEERMRIEAEAKAEAEEEQRRKEAEAKAKAEEERKRKEAEAKAKAEEERKRIEAEARVKAEEERKRIEAEAKAKAEEEQKRKEAEARVKAEEERKRIEAEAKAKATLEAKQKKAEELKKRIEAEEKVRREEEAKKNAEAERQRKEIEAKTKAELEAKQKKAAEVKMRIEAEEKARAAEEARKNAEKEAKRMEEEEKKRTDVEIASKKSGGEAGINTEKEGDEKTAEEKTSIDSEMRSGTETENNLDEGQIEVTEGKTTVVSTAEVENNIDSQSDEVENQETRKVSMKSSDSDEKKEELAELEATVKMKAELEAKEEVEEEKRKIEEEVKKMKAEKEAAEAKKEEEELRIRGAYLDWCLEFSKKPDKIRMQQFKQNYLMLEGIAKDEGKEIKLNAYADYTAVEYEFEMKEKEEAKKKEQEERLKREQEETEAAFAAAGAENKMDTGTEGTDDIKFDRFQKQNESEEVVVGAEETVSDADETKEQPQEEWWKQEEGLDESLLQKESGRWSGLNKEAESKSVRGNTDMGTSRAGQDVDADDPQVRKRVRTAYSNWCRMYNKEPDEGRFPKFKSNYLIMEKLAIKQGREVTLNEFADCTPDEYASASRSKSAGSASRPNSGGTSTFNKREPQKAKVNREINREINQSKASQNAEPELVRTKRTVYVSREDEDDDVDQAALIAEVERFAMQKAEEAAKRVEQFRQQQGIAGFNRERATEERIKREREAAKSELEKRREAALQREAESIAGAQISAKKAEEGSVKRQWEDTRAKSKNPFLEKQRLRRLREEAEREKETTEEDGFYQARQMDSRNPSFIQTDNSRSRDDGNATTPPKMDTEEMQPVVKPPRANPKNPFQRRPTFTSPTKETVGSKSNEYSPLPWQEQEQEQEEVASFQPNGSPSSASNLVDPYRTNDQSDDSLSHKQPGTVSDGSFYQTTPSSTDKEVRNGSSLSGIDDTPIEGFGTSSPFVDNSQGTVSDPNSSPQSSNSDSISNYEDSYFMNVPTNSDEEPQSFDYIQKWAASNQEFSDQPDDARDEPSVDSSDGGAWYGSDESSTTASQSSPNPNPFARRNPLMNKGANYLNNLSRQDGSSLPNGANEAGSSHEESSQQSASSEFPDRIKAAYRDWCQYYGKEYNETRLGTFSSNFLAVERYHRETGVSLILNELADMTSEEFQQNRN